MAAISVGLCMHIATVGRVYGYYEIRGRRHTQPKAVQNITLYPPFISTFRM